MDQAMVNSSLVSWRQPKPTASRPPAYHPASSSVLARKPEIRQRNAALSIRCCEAKHPISAPEVKPAMVRSSMLLRRGPKLPSAYHSASCSVFARKPQIPPRSVSSRTRCEAKDPNSPLEGLPSDVEFCKVEAILRPWRLSHVAAGLLKVGIRGATISDVRGFGAQGGARERQAGSEFGEDSFVSKVKLEVVVSRDQAEMVIETIIEQARTGEIGDGKIFVSPVIDVIRVRTGERGVKAEKMASGRVDPLASSNGRGT